jgi:RimJ/RimL family protein N-acetyltransferase
MSVTVSTDRGSVLIRPTRADDAQAYRALRLEALQHHPAVYGADYAERTASPRSYWEDVVQRGAGGATGVTFVAAANDELIGMTNVVRVTNPKLTHSASMHGVYVQATWRGTGVADALVQACLAWAREHGVRVVKLGVVTTNAAAIKLYLRCGFSVYGVEPEGIAWNGAYYDELMMVYRLHLPA